MAGVDASHETLTPTEQNAFALSRAAIMLDQARQRSDDTGSLADALRHNLELWIGIQTFVKRANGALPDPVKSNLLKLSDFVVGTTLGRGNDIGDNTVDALININLQISEGLLESEAS